nr:hypothetical protein Iba_chr06cCG2050 [Ipomoea batatas]GMD11423.1 hypothetical protein Iba_chr06fCG3580 [Ipomoea batatas]
MVVFTAVISVSGIFMFSSFKNPSPLRQTSVWFLQHPWLQSWSTGFVVLDDEISGGVDEEDSGCAIDGVPESDVSLADGVPGGEETESVRTVIRD